MAALAALDEEVPGVRIGMEEAIDEERLVEGLHELGRDGVRIEAELGECGVVVDLGAGHERHREDVFARELGQDARQEDVGVADEVRVHAGDAAGFVLEVGLALEHLLQLVEDAVDLLEAQEEALVEPRAGAQHAHVDAHGLPDVRIEDLDRDRLAILGHGAMHLTQ